MTNEIHLLEREISACVHELLDDILRFQIQHSPQLSVADNFSYLWNSGTSGRLPILTESTIRDSLLKRLKRNSITARSKAEHPIAPGRKVDVAVFDSTGLVVPIEIKSFPPNSRQRKEIAHTIRDAEKLARSSSGLAFYVIGTSFTGHQYDWSLFGEGFFQDELLRKGFRGRCVVMRLQASHTKVPPAITSGAVVSYVIES